MCPQSSGRRPTDLWGVRRAPRIWEDWPDDLPGIMREAAKRLEQMPWLKPIDALRLWADVLDCQREIDGQPPHNNGTDHA